MNLQTAEKVKEILLGGASEIDGSVALVLSRCHPDLAEIYRRLAAKIMGLVFVNILMPIYAEHPDIEPPGLHGQAGPKPQIPPDVAESLLQLCTDVDIKVGNALTLIEAGVDASDARAFKAGFEEVLQVLGDTKKFVSHAAESSNSSP
ncbi:MAG TPA: hypothetical protein VH988_23120 [Thermoanaerobaculia bacterium]|jgi:hypothetical protein|nr:hypothetical protein [Thermoanaerobaculia bacterium]